MKKSFVIMALSVIVAVVIIILYYNSQSHSDVKLPQEDGASFKGPTGKPYIKGPGGPPPTSAE